MMITRTTLLLLLAATSSVAVSGEVLKLGADNYAKETDGKTVFIKFFAPWCGHCKAMAPDWEKLADEWKGHAVGLVAEVDCTIEANEQLCEDSGVEGYPTVMYGDPDALDPYEGARDYEALAAHAKQYLEKPVCGVKKVDACEPAEKKLIEGLKKKSEEELEKLEAEVDTASKAAYKVLEDGLEELNNQYTKMTEVYEATVAEKKKEHNYKYVTQLLKQIKGPEYMKKKPEDDDDDDEAPDL